MKRESEVTLAGTKSLETVGHGVVCPGCGRRTRKIIVDASRIDWASVPFVGLAAILFPSLASKELQCEHCGRVFPPPRPPAKAGDRLIGFILVGFSLLMVGLVVWLVFFRMIGISE